MQQTERQTFWGLIKNHCISIPIIQRDYAQGRSTPEVKQIRQDLLDSLYKALSGKQALDFDFIYGSIEGDYYMPLDGQQRLTTLFLLHWYLAAREGQLDDVTKTILGKFTYDTRTSAREFCRALVSHQLTGKDGGSLSDEIMDASWFILSWDKDPTIQSMLVMLDAIHERFKNSEAFFKVLTGNDYLPVSFQSLQLEHFGLSDTLYIKMNARGKPLTEFENFKARFEQLLEETCPDKKKEFCEKVDGAWTDLFWQYRDEEYLFDEEFMNFFRAIATNNYALKSETREEEKIIADELANGKVPIYFSRYNELSCFDGKGIAAVSSTLDCLHNGHSTVKTYLPDNTLIDERKLFRQLISNGIDFTYARRIQFFALSQYIIRNSDKEVAGISAWMRIIRNLTENTIYNSADEYVRDIKSVNNLLNHSTAILEYFKEPGNRIEGFANVQRNEECIKAVLLLKSRSWSNVITNIENHVYFKGQVGFLLKFAGISDNYKKDPALEWIEQEDAYFLKRFNEYAQKAMAMFADDGLRDYGDHLWERALLSNGDYLIEHGRNSSFLINDHRDISWKRLLRDDTPRRDLVKNLFDSIQSITTLEGDLRQVILSAINDTNVEPWRKLFIRHAGMIGACNQKFIRWDEEGSYILLLQKSQTNGWHKEGYSYALYLLLKDKGIDVHYAEQASKDEEKYILLDGHKRVSFVKENNVWQYKIVQNGISEFYPTEKSVLDSLTI